MNMERVRTILRTGFGYSEFTESEAQEAREYFDKLLKVQTRKPLESTKKPLNIYGLIEYIAIQKEWSKKTFGPGPRTKGISEHIRKELVEIEKAPSDLSEWIDIIILAIDGAWRTGTIALQIVQALEAKQAKNLAREWPDWRNFSQDEAIEHIRENEAEKPTEAKSGKPSKLPHSFDALDWAHEFMEMWGHRREQIDKDLMINWFANAIMAGQGKAFSSVLENQEKAPINPESTKKAVKMMRDTIDEDEESLRPSVKLVDEVKWCIDNGGTTREALIFKCLLFLMTGENYEAHT